MQLSSKRVKASKLVEQSMKQITANFEASDLYTSQSLRNLRERLEKKDLRKMCLQIQH